VTEVQRSSALEKERIEEELNGNINDRNYRIGVNCLVNKKKMRKDTYNSGRKWVKQLLGKKKGEHPLGRGGKGVAWTMRGKDGEGKWSLQKTFGDQRHRTMTPGEATTLKIG